MKQGRPTKYKEEYCDKIIEYFRVPPTVVEYKEEYYNNGALKARVPIIRANELPTFQGFADHIGVNVDTLMDWTRANENFLRAYTHAKQLQEHIWLTNSMNNLYNAQFAQFFGKNCLGYKDKSEQEIKSDSTVTIKLDKQSENWGK